MEELKKIAAEIKFTPKVELIEKDGQAKLYLYGEIVDEIPQNWWTGEQVEGDYITMQEVKESFAKISGSDVEIHINSRGGDVYASVAIGNYIKDSGKNVTIVIDAIAASGASIIAMSGAKVKMYPNAMMMIHRASVLCYGNASDLQKIAANLEKFDETVQASYLGHFKGTKEELKALIFDETYMTAEDCLNLGFCDEIIEDKKPEEPKEPEGKTSVKESLLAKYKVNTTPNILNKFKGE